MVNKTVFEYFRKNRDKYPIESLKKKALAAGYSQEDVDDAAVMSGKKETKTNNLSKITVSTATHKTFGWMKLAGIFGLFFFVLYLALITAGVYFEVELARYLNIWIVGLLAILSGFYLYGFIRLSENIESKLLKISTYTRIGLLILFIGLYAALRPTFLDTNIGPGSILIGLSFAYTLVFLAAKYTFAISLVKTKETVQFLRVIGILTLIYTSLITLGFLYLAYLFFAGGSLSLSVVSLTILYWDFVVIEIFNISALFFESMALFYAHKKFE